MDVKRIITVLILVVILVVIVVNYTNDSQQSIGLNLQLFATFTPEPSVTPSPPPGGQIQATNSSNGEIGLADVAPTRTPAPTATPGVIDQRISKFVRQRGIQSITILGLRIEDWINLALSILIVLFGFIVGTWLIRRLLPRLFERNNIKLGNDIINNVGEDIRWLATLIAINYAVSRLIFIYSEIKKFTADILFVAMIWFAVHATFKLIDLAEAESKKRTDAAEQGDRITPVLTLTTRILKVLASLLAIMVLLSYFGINVSGLLTVLGLGGLAFSLAAQDTIKDAIAGFIILIDQPFRVGDRIEIEEIGTWGDVVDIGLRTTRIRTRDNRMVIVPNSIIGSNQVINYTYPDPRYRIETHVDIAYGTDIAFARKIIIDTVRGIPGVLPDKPVDALYIEMADFAMRFRVRWWIESYIDTRRMLDHVHTTLDQAFADSGIESPYPTQYVIVGNDPDLPQYYRKEKGRKKTAPVDDETS